MDINPAFATDADHPNHTVEMVDWQREARRLREVLAKLCAMQNDILLLKCTNLSTDDQLTVRRLQQLVCQCTDVLEAA